LIIIETRQFHQRCVYFEKGCPPGALTSFVVYDEKKVTVETVVSEELYDDPKDVAVFNSVFSKVYKSAYFDDVAKEAIEKTIARTEMLAREDVESVPTVKP
jgi:hypothetical protein